MPIKYNFINKTLGQYAYSFKFKLDTSTILLRTNASIILLKTDASTVLLRTYH